MIKTAYQRLIIGLLVISLLQPYLLFLEAKPVLAKNFKDEPQEVLSKRNLTSKTYDNGDGTYTLNSWGAPVHYKDENNNFQDIDTTLLPSSDPNFDLMNLTNNTKTWIKNDPFSDSANIKLQKGNATIELKTINKITIKNENENGQEIIEEEKTKENLKPNNEEKRAEKQGKKETGVQGKESKVTYNKLYEKGSKKIDVSYDVLDLKLTEQIIVNEFLGFPEITQELSLTNAYIQQVEEQIHILDKNTNEILWVLPRPYMYEQGETNPENFKYEVEYDLACQDNRLEINDCSDFFITKVFTDEGKTWLKDNNRNYPVVVDPDFAGHTSDGLIQAYTSPYATARTTSSYAYPTTNTSFMVQNTYDNGVYYISRSFIAFDTSNIGIGSTVTQANLGLDCTSDTSITDFDINIIKYNWIGSWGSSGQGLINRETDWDGALSSSEDDSIWRNTSGLTQNTIHMSGNLSNVWVSKNGFTKYALVSNREYDGNGTEPSGYEQIEIASANNANAAYRPLLRITYTTNNAPSAPTIDNNNVAAVTDDSTPPLQFDMTDPDSGDIVKYQIQIADNAEFTSPIVNVTEETGSASPRNNVTYTPSALDDGSYYWRVKAIDDDLAESDWSTANNGSIAFQVDATSPSIPGTPTISTTSTDNTPTWSFTVATDSGSGLATTPYTLEWSTDSTFVSGVSTANSTTNSYTHTTSLTDGTWYFRVKAADLAGNSSSYSANGTKVIDTTSPTAISLDQPSNNAYINYERPTFRWQASTDATLGISSYTLEVDNGESGDFTLANLPATGTGTTTTYKYVMQYDNFNDSDATNNYISLYTKSSSLWGPTENDGNLKEGKRAWTVKAEDSAGNTVSASRTLFVDRTSPKIEITQINEVPYVSDRYETTDQTPEVFIKITDLLAGNTSSTNATTIQDNKVASGPKSVELKIEKKDGLFYKLHTTYTINPIITSKFACNDTDITNNTLQTCDKYFFFNYQVRESLGNGDYKFSLTGKDEAGNSSDKTIYLKIGNFQQIATDEEKEEAKVEKDAPGQIEITKPSDQEQALDKMMDEIGKGYKESPLNKLITPVISLIQRCLNFKGNLVANLAFNLGQKVENISLNPGLLIVKIGYFFVREETTISDVKVNNLTENSATISWTTNHPATGKVNYGKTEDYGQDIQTTKRTTYHEFTIENLEPGTTYYYEVMSQNKNYVHDAKHTFKTPPND